MFTDLCNYHYNQFQSILITPKNKTCALGEQPRGCRGFCCWRQTTAQTATRLQLPRTLTCLLPALRALVLFWLAKERNENKANCIWKKKKKRNPVPFSCPPLSPWHALIYFLSTWLCLFWTCRHAENHVASCDWCFSLSIVTSRCTHVAACNFPVFLFATKHSSIVWVEHLLFIHLLPDAHFFFKGLTQVPRLGVEQELQPPAYARATATRDLSHICNLHHGTRQCQSLNPLSIGQGSNP